MPWWSSEATVRASITALFRRLSAEGTDGTDGIHAYGTSITPADAAFDATDDLHLGAQRVAAATVRALRLPDARMGAQLALSGREPRGDLGRAIAALADRCEAGT